MVALLKLNAVVGVKGTVETANGVDGGQFDPRRALASAWTDGPIAISIPARSLRFRAPSIDGEGHRK